MSMGTEYLHYQNLAASGKIDMMKDAITGESALRTPTRPSRVTVAIWANAANIQYRIEAGTRTVVFPSSMEAGGTDGQFPDPRVLGKSFVVAALETLRIICEETSGSTATTDIMAVVDVTPIR